MRTGDLVASKIATISAGASLSDAADLMRSLRVRQLPVVDGGRLVGLLSDLDLDAAWPSAVTTLEAREVPVRLSRVRVDSVMTRNVVSVRPETPILMTAGLMRHWGLRALPVVRRGQVVGIVSERDVLAGLLALGDEREPIPHDEFSLAEDECPALAA